MLNTVFRNIIQDIVGIEIGAGISRHKRLGKWSGTIGSGGSFVKELKVNNVHKQYGMPFLGLEDFSGAGFVYDVSLELLNPIEFTDDSRFETFSSWHNSGNEFIYMANSLQRKLKRFPEVFADVGAILESEKEAVIDSFQGQYDYYSSNPGSIEQFKHYIRKVSSSAVPRQLGGGEKAYWGDYLLKDGKLTTEGLLIKTKIDKFNKQMGAEKQFLELVKGGYQIRVEALNSALRARKAEYKILKREIKRIMLIAKKNRDRTADGADYFSQEGYANKDNPEYKKHSMAKTYALIRSISNCLNFSEEGAKLYLDLNKLDDIVYADLANGEAQCAYFLGYLPYNYSISGIVPEVTQKMCSGINNTPNLNALVASAYAKFLQEEENIGQIGIGADNLYIPTSEIEWLEIVKKYDKDYDPEAPSYLIGGLDKAERFLGFRKDQHYPVQLVRDSPRHNSGWNNFYNGFKGARSAVSIDRIFGTILMYDYWNTGSGLKLYEWVTSTEKLNDSFKENFGHAKDWLLDNLHDDAMKVKIYEQFSEEYEKTKKLKLSTEEDFDDWKWDFKTHF